MTDGDGVTIEGEGAGELPEDATNLARPRLRPARGSRWQALRLPEPDPARARARLVRGGDRARARRRAAGRATPRSCSRPASTLESHADNLAAALVGRRDADLGRADRPDRRHAAARAGRGRPARADVDRGVAPRAPVRRPPRRGGGERRARGAARGRRGRRVTPTLFAAALDDRLHEPYRASPVLDAVRAELPPGARGATLSGSGPTVIVWADDAAACAAALAERFPEHDVATLASSPRGAL